MEVRTMEGYTKRIADALKLAKALEEVAANFQPATLADAARMLQMVACDAQSIGIMLDGGAYDDYEAQCWCRVPADAAASGHDSACAPALAAAIMSPAGLVAQLNAFSEFAEQWFGENSVPEDWRGRIMCANEAIREARAALAAAGIGGVA